MFAHPRMTLSSERIETVHSPAISHCHGEGPIVKTHDIEIHPHTETGEPSKKEYERPTPIAEGTSSLRWNHPRINL